MERNIYVISQVLKVVADYKQNYTKSGNNHELHQRGAERILKIAERNGGVYIKLGQHVSSLVYLVPDEYVTTLSTLQDKCPQSSLTSIDEMVKEETGYPLQSLFKDINPIPIGTASLAQVHICNEYAIKFQHPTMIKYAKQDMFIVERMTKYVKYLFPDFNLQWLSEEMNTNLPKEMDFRIEANNAERCRANFFGYNYKIHNEPKFNEFYKQRCNKLQSFGSVDRVLKIPKIHFATKRVLCMEYVNGARLNDLGYMRKHGIQPHQVARSLAYLFGNMIFLHGYVHCDPHLGNLMVQARPYKSVFHSFFNLITGTPNFYLVLLDHGLYRELTPEFKTSYAYLWRALASGNENDIKYWSNKVGNVSSYKLFSSMLTGRSWETINQTQLNTERSTREQEAISRANIYIKDIADILATVPRELLLVLKTNDLLRSADYCLGCGPYISYFSLLRLINVGIYNEEHDIFKFLQQDIKWRMLDYSLGFYYTSRSWIKTLMLK